MRGRGCVLGWGVWLDRGAGTGGTELASVGEPA
jgi:hypothetical protein